MARDIAHAKLKELIDNGEALPQYVKDHPIYYAGPAKRQLVTLPAPRPNHCRPHGLYVDLLQSHGASMVMLAKGNRSQQVTDACHKHGGFYLGSIGGPAAVLAQQSIKSLECVAYPELGWKLSGKSKWKIFRRLSSSMIKATTSSSRSRISSARAVNSTANAIL